MKSVKVFFLIAIILLLSGCKIKYTLIISDDYFDEKISVKFPTTEKNSKEIAGIISPLHYETDAKYDKNVEIKNGNTFLDLHYKYKLEEFVSANSANRYFYNRDIKIDDNTILLDLNDFSGFAPNVDFDIVIKTKNKVISNNADEVKKDSYIWHVKKDKKQKVRVRIKIKKKNGKNNVNNKSNAIWGYLIILIVMIISLLMIFLSYRRRKKNSSF